MKTSLIILVLALIGFSHAGFAQAPKEVIVLDGQIAINNGPINPASVMVENGIVNPVPILDVTPERGQPAFLEFFIIRAPGSTSASGGQFIPPGKLFKMTGISVSLIGNSDSSFRFVVRADMDWGGGQILNRDIVLGAPHQALANSNRSIGTLYQEFDDFPLMQTRVELIGSRNRPNDALHSTPAEMTGLMWGYFVDAPVP